MSPAVAAGYHGAMNALSLHADLGGVFTAPNYAFALVADSTDAALLLRRQAGAYTVQVSGVANTTGVVLVEVYDVK